MASIVKHSIANQLFRSMQELLESFEENERQDVAKALN